MFKKDKMNINGKKIDTLVGPQTSMSGKLQAKGIVRIEGTFEGEINTESDLIIGEKAEVKGEFRCLNATVAGKVEGNFAVLKKMEIYKSGIILGDIKVGSLMVEDGAFFSGKCLMDTGEEKPGTGKKELSYREKKKEERPEHKNTTSNTINLNSKMAKNK